MEINLETASAAELKRWKQTIDWDDAPPGSLDQLNDLIIERTVEERVEASQNKLQAGTKAKQADEMAMRRWPELKDKESAFSKRVAELMAGPDAPSSLLHAANEVGIQMFGNGAQRVPPLNMVASGHSDNAPEFGDNFNDANFLKRTEKLQNLLVGEGLIKNDPETLARIAARAKEDTSNGPTA